MRSLTADQHAVFRNIGRGVLVLEGDRYIFEAEQVQLSPSTVHVPCTAEHHQRFVELGLTRRDGDTGNVFILTPLGIDAVMPM